MNLSFHLYFALGCVWSIQILKFQENLKYFGTTYDTYDISSLSTGWTTSNQFGFSIWSTTAVLPTGWQDYYRVSNTNQDFYDGRVLLFEIQASQTAFLHSGSTSSPNGAWWNWIGSNTDTTFFPLNQWVFIALAINISSNTENGFRYTLSSTTSQIEFQNRPPLGGSFYPLSQSGTVFIGGHPDEGDYCSCTLQYARVYIDYFPDSIDEMINLAIMDTSTGNLYILYFASDPTIDDNSTVPVLVVETASNTTSSANKGDTSTAMPLLGAYNTLNCRSISILSLDSGASTTNGMVIAMDINPLDSATSNQVIFSVRDSSTNQVSLAFRFQPPSNTDLVTNYGSGWNAPIEGPSLTPNAWNRLVVEIVQAQPTGFGVGFSTFRAWVNGTEISPVPVGDFSSSEIPFPDMSEATLDLCSQKSYGTSDSVEGFNGDILNLLWYRGAEALYVNASDPSCLLSGFLDPNQIACLQCNVGYYFYDMICVSSCPSGYYTHQDTKSCLKCQFPEEYFDSNGFCTPCNSTGQVLIQGICQECNETCATCNQAGPSQCTSCDYPRELINNSCPITYMSLASAKTLGNGVNVAIQTLIVTSSILPAVTAGLSTTALLLTDFVAEFALYKYINVPFPENFIIFCQQTGVSALQNIFAGMDTVNRGSNPISTIGKFQFWGVSATLLDNSYTNIFKELIALGIILVSNILVFIFKRNQKLRSTFFKIRTLFMWNVFLSYFLGDFSELQLNSMIQMRENYVSSAYSDFSLALAIIIVVTYSGLFPYMVYILNRRRLHQEEPELTI